MRASEDGYREANRIVVEEQSKNPLLTAELEWVKVELVDYRVGEEGRWTEKKKAFLELLEFFNPLGNRFAFLF